MRKIIVLGALATVLGLAAAAQASDFTGASDRSTAAMTREIASDGAGDRQERDEWKGRSRERNDRSDRSHETRERNDRSARSGETLAQHEAREGHDESRERDDRR